MDDIVVTQSSPSYAGRPAEAFELYSVTEWYSRLDNKPPFPRVYPGPLSCCRSLADSSILTSQSDWCDNISR